MNTGKVILATIIIFAAGVMTGGLLVKLTKSPLPASPAPIPMRVEMVRRLTHDLDLTSDQRQRIDGALRDSQERIRILWELQEPERREEFKKLREDIRGILTPEQRKRFDEMFRERQRQMQQRQQSGFRSGQTLRGPFRQDPPLGQRPAERARDYRSSTPRETEKTNQPDPSARKP